jgi:preprotein translocase subunit SecE
MKLYKYIDGVKVTKYPMLALYIERMQESWEAKVFGITLPLFAISMIALIIIFPIGEPNLLAFIIQGAISLWFIISYTLLVNRQIKDKNQELKDAIWRNSKKVSNIFILFATFIFFFNIYLWSLPQKSWRRINITHGK